MPPVIDKDLCEQCGTCYDICPQDIFSENNDQPPSVTYPDECWYCGACVIDCPENAIRLKLPLQMQIVPSPALYGDPDTKETDALKASAAFTRSIVE